jgi:hypothetical protein
MTSINPLFPEWFNKLVPLGGTVVVGGLIYLIALTVYATSPQTTSVGYQPEQPVAYSHALHAGELGIDCRYCHTDAEQGAHANIPPTQTCMNCHNSIKTESELLLPVRESYATGMPIQWVRIHDLPDFAYFDHSAHVRRGIGCVSCHGRVDKMEVVYQAEPLHMGWCLDCHRNPDQYLRPVEYVTKMDWVAADQQELGQRLKDEYDINPSTDCSTCHR